MIIRIRSGVTGAISDGVDNALRAGCSPILPRHPHHHGGEHVVEPVEARQPNAVLGAIRPATLTTSSPPWCIGWRERTRAGMYSEAATGPDRPDGGCTERCEKRR